MPTDPHPMPIVFDTDIGTDVDDALALAFILASPELDLKGVTIVDGDVDTRAAIAARLLGMAGRTDIPVVKGAGRPFGMGRGPTWFGHEGKGCLDVPYDGPAAPILDVSAAEWLVDEASAPPFHLVAVGPFTNVAEAVRLDASFPKKVDGLTVMGGMAHPESYLPAWHAFFDATGISPAHMDHNSQSDPLAAYEMAGAGFAMRWVTAELTFCTPLHESAIGRFEASGSEFGACLARMTRIWSDEHFHVIPQYPEDRGKPFPADSVACLHDPLAVASLFGGTWLRTRPHKLGFSIEDPYFRMRERRDAEEHDAEHLVSVSVDAPAFHDLFIDRVGTFLDGLGHDVPEGG